MHRYTVQTDVRHICNDSSRTMKYHQYYRDFLIIDHHVILNNKRMSAL